MFLPSEKAWGKWLELLEDYDNLVPDDVAKKSLIFQENIKWIDDAVKRLGKFEEYGVFYLGELDKVF